MRVLQRWLAVTLLVLPLCKVDAHTVRSTRPASHLVTCGGPEVRVYIYQPDQPLVLEAHWSAQDDAAVPPALVNSFATVAECKSVDGGRGILIASSHDGVAILDRAGMRARFVARVGHAHSGDVSPNGLVLIAGAEGERGGNVLALYDRKQSNKRLVELPLPAAHGVAYDPHRRAFWALGGDALLLVRATTRPYPSLTIIKRIPLPSQKGHDLAWWGRSRLSITTDKGAYLFDPSTYMFSRNVRIVLPDFVKSVSWSNISPIIFVRADDAPNGVWWSHRIQLIGQTKPLAVSEKVYKARWWDSYDHN